MGPHVELGAPARPGRPGARRSAGLRQRGIPQPVVGRHAMRVNTRETARIAVRRLLVIKPRAHRESLVVSFELR